MNWRPEARWGAAVGLACLVLLTQAGSLAREVIDWDESTFILLAGRLLDGHLPYADLFDNKPPMMFFNLAAIMAVFGENLIAVRLFGDACIVVVVLMTVACLERLFPPWPSWLAGACLVAAFATWPGQHTSTELPAMALVMGGLWLIMARGDRSWALVTAGVLVSLAVLTRSNLAVLAVAVGAWLMVVGLFFPRVGIPRWGFLFYASGGMIPLVAFLILYGAAGALDDFMLAVVWVPLNYAGEQESMADVALTLISGWSTMISWAPVWHGGLPALTLGGLAVVLGVSLRGRVPRAIWPEISLVFCFAAATALSVLISGAGYMHYWLHLLPFAAFLIAAFLAWLWTGPLAIALAVACVAAVTLSSLRHTTPELLNWLLAPEPLSRNWHLQHTAQQIAPVLQPEDEIWAVERHLVLWYLSRAPVSPAAAHPDNINRPAILEPLVAFGYEAPDILERTYQSNPAFIVTSGRGTPAYLQDGPRDFNAYLSEGYGLFFEAEGVAVFRRLGHGGWRGRV